MVFSMIIDKLSIIPKNRENRDFEAMGDEQQVIYNYSLNVDLGNNQI